MKAEKPYKRVDRVNNQILDILSNILIKNIDLSYLGFVTFTKVDTAPDLKSAKVYYSIVSPKFSDGHTEEEIRKKKKAFKKFMGPELKLKNTPDLKFYLDETMKYSEKIDRLLKDSNSI